MEFIFAEPDTILVFTIFYKLFGGGTRLAMPKTICAPDSSSLKPGSGATKGHTESVTMVGDLHIRIAKLAFHAKESPIRTRDEVFNLVSS